MPCTSKCMPCSHFEPHCPVQFLDRREKERERERQRERERFNWMWLHDDEKFIVCDLCCLNSRNKRCYFLRCRWSLEFRHSREKWQVLASPLPVYTRVTYYCTGSNSIVAWFLSMSTEGVQGPFVAIRNLDYHCIQYIKTAFSIHSYYM